MMHKCPECGTTTLNIKYEYGVAIAWCTNCEYVKSTWPFYEQAVKKMREKGKRSTGNSGPGQLFL
ncbi:MAG TPA: hypothetical protein VM123_07260 [archaeon]|nr:hypothetical protein [archaeon]